MQNMIWNLLTFNNCKLLITLNFLFFLQKLMEKYGGNNIHFTHNLFNSPYKICWIYRKWFWLPTFWKTSLLCWFRWKLPRFWASKICYRRRFKQKLLWFCYRWLQVTLFKKLLITWSHLLFQPEFQLEMFQMATDDSFQEINY